MSVWKSDETLLSICILNFSFKNDFVWEEISNIRHSVSSPDETPRSSSKILRCASYFQLSSRCFIWWWNTASHVWYITWRLDASLILDFGNTGLCFSIMYSFYDCGAVLAKGHLGLSDHVRLKHRGNIFMFAL